MMKTLTSLVLLYFSTLLLAHTQPAQRDKLRFLQENISFHSSGVLVKGWLFLPDKHGKSKKPVIVMAPGFSGVKECNYQFFAERFADAGYAVLLFDFPNFGESGGEIRQEADPWQQVNAYRDAVTFVSLDDRLDAERIGVWGGSYSGGHAIVVSAVDPRVKCFVAVTPYLGGYDVLDKFPEDKLAQLNKQFNEDRLQRMQGKAPAMIPVVSDQKGANCVLTGANAWKFTESFKSYAPNWKNEVTLRSLELQLNYHPIYYVALARKKPKLFIGAIDDELIPEWQLNRALKQAYTPKDLVFVEGHHFSPYQESFEKTTRLALEFFEQYLKPKK